MNRYLLKEHLILDAGGKEALELLKKRLLAFSAVLMPREKVHRCELALRTGKTLHAFVGKLATPEFYGLILALDTEEELEFIGFYEYDWESFWPQSRDGDPFALQSYFLRAGDREGVFYSSYTVDEEEPGELFAWGKKNGRQYRGVVRFLPLEQMPDYGRWFAPKVQVHLTHEQLQKIDIHRLLPVCRRLCNLGGEQELYFAGHCFHFSLRGLELYKGEDLQKYLALCGALEEVTGGLCQAYGELADLSSADPGLLVEDPLPDGSTRMQISML